MIKKAKIFFTIIFTSVLLNGCNNTEEFSISSYCDYSLTNTVSENSDDMPVDTSTIYDIKSKYFVKKLNQNLLANFIELYNSVTEFKESVDFKYPIKTDEFNTLMFLLNYDCPELIQMSENYFPTYSNQKQTAVSSVELRYCMNKEDYIQAKKEIDIFLSELKKNVLEKSDSEKEKYVYDYILKKCKYNDTYEFSGSAYGILIKNNGRCEAICKAFMWCMRELNVECISVSGSQNWDMKSIYSDHSWNIIKINGEYYHLDLTVDNLMQNDSEKIPPCYGFFNVDDNSINQNRKINTVFTSLGVPECTSLKENYHIINKLYVGDMTDIKSKVYNILKNNVKKSSDNISIKFKNKADYEQATKNIDKWINEFCDKNKYNKFTYKKYYNPLSHTIVIQYN